MHGRAAVNAPLELVHVLVPRSAACSEDPPPGDAEIRPRSVGATPMRACVARRCV